MQKIIAIFFRFPYNESMENFCVAVSSSADLFEDELQNNEIQTLSFRYFDSRTYREESVARTPAFKRFYERLREGEDCSLRFPDQKEYEDFFDALVESGKTKIVYLASSQNLRDDYRKAQNAATLCMVKFKKSEIYVVDTQTAGPQKGILALRAANMRATFSAAEAAVLLAEQCKRAVTFAIAYDTAYLVKEGLLPASALRGGDRLGVKPVLTFDAEGNLSLFRRCTSEKNAIASVLRYAEQVGADKTSFFVYNADNVRNELFWISQLQQKFPGCIVKTGSLGMTNARIFGPNALMIGFDGVRVPVAKKKKPIHLYEDYTPFD